MLSRRHPELLDAGLVDWCGSRKVNKLEYAWDKRMVEQVLYMYMRMLDMSRQVRVRVRVRVHVDRCTHI